MTGHTVTEVQSGWLYFKDSVISECLSTVNVSKYFIYNFILGRTAPPQTPPRLNKILLTNSDPNLKAKSVRPFIYSLAVQSHQAIRLASPMLALPQTKSS